MNLLLHAESRNLIRRLRQNGVAACPAADPLDMLVTLDDEIFEELGYFGALAEKEADRQGSVFREWLDGVD